MLKIPNGIAQLIALAPTLRRINLICVRAWGGMGVGF